MTPTKKEVVRNWHDGTASVIPKQFRILVDLKGFEPLTSSMPWKRAPNCATGPLIQRLTKFLGLLTFPSRRFRSTMSIIASTRVGLFFNRL
jgi:hypothetical protein